jgi:hypothetical protein
VKHVAFVVGLLVGAFGAAGAIDPSILVSVARRALTSEAFYLVGAIRVAFGLVLITVAHASRTPRALKALGVVVLVAGVAAVLTGWAAMDRARTIVEWWSRQGPGAVRVVGAGVLALGSFVAYACAPARARARLPRE